MGNTVTGSHFDNKETTLPNLLSVAEKCGVLPDVGIDECLVKFSGLNSAVELENSVKEMTSRIPDYVQSLSSALAAFKPVPNAVGLGALTLAAALELIIRSQPESDSTLDMLRRVFAEEKASGVRDSMEEYLKRLHMLLHQLSRALEETERLEKQLSEQLTRLKNSMLHDKQMSSRSLKHWTNGAAFHLQMLIHAARLKIQSTAEHEAQLQVHQSSIISLLDWYEKDLDELLKQYKTYKNSTISIYPPRPMIVGMPSDPIVITDKELKKGTSSVRSGTWISSPDYVDYMFDNWKQLKELKSYFSDLKGNIKDLIKQNYEFKIQKVLPVSNKQGA